MLVVKKLSIQIALQVNLCTISYSHKDNSLDKSCFMSYQIITTYQFLARSSNVCATLPVQDYWHNRLLFVLVQVVVVVVSFISNRTQQ